MEGGLISETVLTSAIVALSGVVGFLWRHFEKKGQEQEKMLTARWLKCEEEHAAAASKVLDVSKRLSFLEGHMDGERKMAQQVLDRIEAVMAHDRPILDDKGRKVALSEDLREPEDNKG